MYENELIREVIIRGKVISLVTLSNEEEQRYLRHLNLTEIGKKGQLKLKKAKIIVVGTGGLGSPVLFYLAAAGIGKLGLVDSDKVELSNLQRQILHRTADLGKAKVLSAYEKLTSLNPNVNVVVYEERLNKENAADIIKEYDIVVDAADNFPTRYILNEACVKNNKPFVHGGVSGFLGQVMTILPGQGPCFKCVFKEPPSPDLVPAAPGVLGAVPGTIGTIQATEVIKLVLGKGQVLAGKILLYDALEPCFREIEVTRNPSCELCGKPM